MKKIFLPYLFAIVIVPSAIFSQSKSLQAGIKFTGELTLYDGLAPGAGGQLVYIMSKNSGIESGIFWQKRRFATIVTEGFPVNQEFYTSEIYSHRLQIPLLYRYSSKAINFNAGPVIDIPIGISVKTKDPDPSLKNYKNYKTGIILTGGISHSFYIGSEIILEPEINFNYLTVRNDGGVGINLALRKKIF